MPHLRHVTGEASRLREQMHAALPAPGCFATPCQSGYSLRADLPHPQTTRYDFCHYELLAELLSVRAIDPFSAHQPFLDFHCQQHNTGNH
ncbi:MAG: hypothetical protein WA635_11940, partial [Gallionella sp.]